MCTAVNVVTILVGAQIPENAGMVARAMKAFGASDLRFVAPEFALNDASPAYKTASGAHDVLRTARVLPSLREALADCFHGVAFSRRTYDALLPRMTLSELAERRWHRAETSPLALVFGPEDFGLSREDVDLCDAVVRIPLAVGTMSLNLAQAVTAALYELARSPVHTSSKAPALAIAHEDRERLLDGAIALLETTEYFKPGRKPRQIEALRAIIRKAGMTREEYHAVQGAMNALIKAARTGER